MKPNSLVVALILGSLLASSACVVAQERRVHDPHKQATRLSKRLNLSSDQTAKLEPLLSQHHEQAVTIEQNTALNADQKQKQLRELNHSMRRQIADILTPEQKEQWKRVREENKGRHELAAPPTR